MSGDGGLDEAMREIAASRAARDEQLRRAAAAEEAQLEAEHEQVRKAVAAFTQRAGPPTEVIEVWVGQRDEETGKWWSGKLTRSVQVYRKTRAWRVQEHVASSRSSEWDDMAHVTFSSGSASIYLTEDGEFVHGPESPHQGKPYFPSRANSPHAREIVELLGKALLRQT